MVWTNEYQGRNCQKVRTKIKYMGIELKSKINKVIQKKRRKWERKGGSKGKDKYGVERDHRNGSSEREHWGMTEHW